MIRAGNSRVPNFGKKGRVACAAALALALSACGGGGGGAGFPIAGGTGPAAGGDAAPATATFSGTAAAGLPLVGSVTVKDAKGATKTVPLSADGAYTVDVTGMTGPFVFRAEGTVSGQRYAIHSAATAADANGTINITPLTDLVVANIAGQLAEKYFDNGNFALTQTELDAEVAGLKAKLMPVLLAMGVDAGIDLLRSSFTPLSSALDKALDVLRVSVDPATNVATITNIVTQQQITDDLAIKAAAETATVPMDGSGMATAADDLTLIRKMLSDFTSKFANGSPAPAELLPLLTSTDPVTGAYNFLFFDQNATQFANEEVTDVNLVGGSFTEVVFRKINYAISADNQSPRAFVEFTHKDRNGVAFSRQSNVQLVKGTDGTWRMRGDGRVLDTATHVRAVKDSSSGCVSTGYEFSIEDTETGNSGNIAAVVVTGPGLPAAGVRHVRPASGGYWPIAGGNSGNAYVMASNCSNGVVSAGLSDSEIAAIPDNAEYKLTALDANDQVAQRGGFDIVYKDRVPRRPLTLAEAAAAAFPVVSTSTPLNAYAGGALTVSATGLNPAFATSLRLGLTGNPFGTESTDADLAPNADGTASKTLTLSVAGTVLGKDVSATTMDAYWRELIVRDYAQ
jgi:hypothetical protein